MEYIKSIESQSLECLNARQFAVASHLGERPIVLILCLNPEAVHTKKYPGWHEFGYYRFSKFTTSIAHPIVCTIWNTHKRHVSSSVVLWYAVSSYVPKHSNKVSDKGMIMDECHLPTLPSVLLDIVKQSSIALWLSSHATREGIQKSHVL